MKKFILVFLFLIFILNAEIIKIDIEKDTFIAKDKPEISLKDVKFGGVRSWWSYYLFKIDTEKLKEKIKNRKIKDAYFNFYITWFEVHPRGFAPEETKSEIQFYPILKKWDEDATFIYPSLKNKEIKWSLKRGIDYTEKPFVIYKIENKSGNEIKGKKRIGGFGDIIKAWVEGSIENNGILMMIVQEEKNTPYLIQINVSTRKEENKERIPYFEIELE